MYFFIFLPHLPSLLYCYTADSIIYSCLQQYYVWLDLTEHSVAHLYHQELGSRIQEMPLFFYSSDETQVQIQIKDVNRREKLRSKIDILMSEGIQL